MSGGTAWRVLFFAGLGEIDGAVGLTLLTADTH